FIVRCLSSVAFSDSDGLYIERSFFGPSAGSGSAVHHATTCPRAREKATPGPRGRFFRLPARVSRRHPEFIEGPEKPLHAPHPPRRARRCGRARRLHRKPIATPAGAA